MRAAILVLAGPILAGSLATAPALADDKSDVLAAAKAYADDFNKGDMAGAAALCTGQAAIIDDFPPHIWQGANACADWAAALAAAAKERGYTDLHVTTAKPRSVSATGDRAYAVLPTTYSYKNKGKPVNERGLWTFSMQKVDAGWRITGWSWAAE
jgi:ketosteroid isomerase-like protein